MAECYEKRISVALLDLRSRSIYHFALDYTVHYEVVLILVVLHEEPHISDEFASSAGTILQRQLGTV